MDKKKSVKTCIETMESVKKINTGQKLEQIE
jgi:hypothetical protein